MAITKRRLEKIGIGVLAALLAASLYTYFATRDVDVVPAAQKKAAVDQPVLDTALLHTALSLSSLAATTEEQAKAREAWRMADHELDLAFAASLRAAEADAAIPKSGPMRQLTDRIARLKERVEAGKKHVKELANEDPEELELAQAHLDLDENELDDAQQDLARAGGDKRAKLQQLLQEHEASEKVADQSLKFGAAGSVDTLYDQVREFFALGDYRTRLLDAAQQADAHAKTVLDRRAFLEAQLPKQTDSDATAAHIRQLSDQRRSVAALGERLDDSKQLASVYRSWAGLVDARQRSALHWMMRSLALIFAVLIAGWVSNELLSRSFRKADRRRLHQLRIITRTALQVVVVILVILVIFGPPTQVSTMIGLVTAGLTVVMKDFIVAFFGWFTLMGKNGISVGDWVEIEGVSGEVIEIGVLKTVLLELGNWTETGHPTGRRVAFSNSFAMERHYFNFSTAGQWLWDELQCALPGTSDPYQTAQQIREIVERETHEDAEQAATDWQRVTRSESRDFSAAPAVSLRPGQNGLEVVVRYITRAPRRNALKSRLFQEIVELLRKPAFS